MCILSYFFLLGHEKLTLTFSLNFQNEIQRAIQQCKEQSFSMLERSLNAVEKASADGGVDPVVMFEVGRHWCYLFEKHASSSAAAGGGGNNAPPSAAGGVGARHSAMAAAQPHHPPQLRPDQFNPVQGAYLGFSSLVSLHHSTQKTI